MDKIVDFKTTCNDLDVEFEVMPLVNINDIENEEFFASITNLSINGKTTKKETPDIISAKVDYRIFYSNAKDSEKTSSNKDKSEKSK